MSERAFNKIAEGLEQAAAHARGEDMATYQMRRFPKIMAALRQSELEDDKRKKAPDPKAEG